ncbi:MAG TPA: SHOCT domain-containing protein [Smithella sp.]|nr:SHOCT domain-containing protein [Smithella sp.]
MKRKYFSSQIILNFLAWFLLICIFGCAYSKNLVDTTPVLPSTAGLNKLPLKAALYIPESTRNYTQPTDASRGCIAMHIKGAFGQIFAGTVEGTLRQIFSDLTVVTQPVANGYDILIQADLQEYIYKAGCMANPGSYGIVKGDIWALDGKAQEIWRSKETSKKLSFTSTWEELVPESMASLAGTWAQELASQPQIKQLQNKTTGNPSSGTETNTKNSDAQRLRELKKLKDEGPLTNEEYEQKRKAIVEGM